MKNVAINLNLARLFLKMRPFGLNCSSFEIKNVSLAFQIESVLENSFSMVINSMSLATFGNRVTFGASFEEIRLKFS